MSFRPENFGEPTSSWENPKKFLKRRKTTARPNASFENENKFNLLESEMDLDANSDLHSSNFEENASLKVKIPPIVVHSFVNNHMETLNNIKKELKEDFEIVAKRNRIIMKTKNIDDYNTMLKKCVLKG